MIETAYFSDFSKSIDKNHENSTDPLENISANFLSNTSASFFQWNSHREASFRETRSRAETNHVNEIKVSNFYQLAFLPMVQEINHDFKKMKQRDLKLQKFAEGNALSSEDLKYIVDTSELLNSCVDRKFLKESIKIIDEKVIENLELYLAETILMNYQEIKAVIRESRLKYLKKKNKEFLKENEKKEDEIKRNQNVEKKKVEGKPIIKMYRKICEKMEKDGKFSKRNSAKKLIKTSNLMQEMKRRTFHPPSKLMSVSAYPKNDFYDEKRGKTNKVTLENFSIS